MAPSYENNKVFWGGGMFLASLAMVSIIVSALFTIDQRQQAQCQASYNARFTMAIQAQQEIQQSDRENLERMIRGVLLPDPDDRLKAVEDYLEVKEANDAERADNPLPDLSEKLQC